MNTNTDNLRARNLRTLALLAGLFIVPLVVAFALYYGSDWRPGGHVNHGVLITPPRPVPKVALPRLSEAPATPGPATLAAFHDTWSLVYIDDSGPCLQECRAALVLMRQTRLGLNTDMTRVQRVMLGNRGCCERDFLAREQAGLILLDAAGPNGQQLLQVFPAPERAHTVYVVDPLGNLMMSYDARLNPRGLLEDLKKLLRLSQIG